MQKEGPRWERHKQKGQKKNIVCFVGSEEEEEEEEEAPFWRIVIL